MKEIVVVMGYNAAGKSTLVKDYESRGYHRINRDSTGGSLDSQVGHVKEALAKKGVTKIVLDNTYRNRESRASLIEFAKKESIPVTCVWLDTSFEDAQLNACFRQVERLGRLLMPEDYKTTKDPNLFPPAALFSYRKQFEEPTVAEGFKSVEKVPFVRNPLAHTEGALILDYDDNIRRSLGTEPFPTCIQDIEILPGRNKRIKEYMKEHKITKLLGMSNMSPVGKGTISLTTAVDCYNHTNTELGLKIEYLFCPHRSPPAVFCYCRKPAPGMAVVHIMKHKLNPAKCLFVGDQKTDETCANRVGFQFQHTNEFFK